LEKNLMERDILNIFKIRDTGDGSPFHFRKKILVYLK